MLKSKNNIYAFLGAMACVMAMPSEGNAMYHKKTTTTTEEWGVPTNRAPIHKTAKDLINEDWRIQLFSIPKAHGKPAAHNQLEEMRHRAPSIAHYSALVASEQGSQWLRGQIGPFKNQQGAASMQTTLRNIFTKDLPTVSSPGIVHQPGFVLEEAESHIWK